MYKILLLLLVSFTTYAQAITATLSASEVALEDSFKLSINFEYDGDLEPYVTFNLKNAEIISDNTNDPSRLMVKGYFAGGKMTQKKVYNYVYELKALSNGSALVKDIKVDLGGKVVKHRTLTIRVLRERAKLQDYFVRAEVSKTQAYVGEKIELNYYVYFKGEITSPEFVKFPIQKNFLKRFELPRVNVERVSISGEVFKRLLVYKSVLYPEKAGDLSIDPVEVRIQYPDYRSRNRNAFGMSFSFSTATYKTKVLRSDRVKIKSLEIPTANMPKSFTGLVGDHKFNLSLNKNKIVVNDVLEARLEVQGDGALEKFDAPRIISSDSFEVFETRAEMVEKTPLDKNKVFDYTFLAKSSDDIPQREIELAVFNPETGQFDISKIEIPALAIIGSGTISTNLASSETKEVNQTQQPRQEILKSELSENIMAPIFKPRLSRNIWKIVNYVLSGFVVLLVIAAMLPFVTIFRRDPFRELKKNFNYSQIFKHICAHVEDGDSLIEKVNYVDLSAPTKKYFVDLIENASKNEYKGAKLPLKYEASCWQELLRASHGNH